VLCVFACHIASKHFVPLHKVRSQQVHEKWAIEWQIRVPEGYFYTAMPVIWAEKYSDLLKIEPLRREHVLFWEKYILKFRHHWELNQRSLPFSQNINVTCHSEHSQYNLTFSRCGLTIWQIYSSLRFGSLHNGLKYYLEVQISQRVNQYIHNICGLKGASQEIVVKLSLQVCQPVRHSKRPCWRVDGARQLLMAVLMAVLHVR